MSIVLIGGMKRQEQHYLEEARRHGIDLQVFNQASRRMTRQIGRADALILFTGKVSHEAREQALSAARRQNVPIHQQHACGLCSLRQCFCCILNQASRIESAQSRAE